MAEGDQPQAGAATLVDPYRGFNFRLEIRGVTQGHFVECSGLGVRIPPIRYREGGLGQVVRAIPGAVDYAEVTLRYGVTKTHELWDWLMLTVKGTVDRRSVHVIVLEPNGADEAFRWSLTNAWPSGWRGPLLDATGNEIAIEELTLAFEGLERA
jgi:phage tail-like protein